MLFVILGIVLFAVAVLIWALAEPHCPQFTVIRMTDADRPSLRILFFSDIHLEHCFVKPEYITSLIDKESHNGLDAVIFGGDVSGDASCVPKGIAYLRTIAECCRAHDIPFLGVTGNHDAELTPEQEAECGFESLEGTYKEIGGFAIAGVDDSGRRERVWYEPVKMPGDKKHILIAHDPDCILHLTAPEEIDYMLSGHIHGGQIRTHFRVEFLILREDELPKKGIFKGVHKLGNTTLFISRGVGCVKMPLRLGSRPEVSVVEF